MTESTPEFRRASGQARSWKWVSRLAGIAVAVTVISGALILPAIFVPRGVRLWQEHQDRKEQKYQEPPAPPAIVISDDGRNAVSVGKECWVDIGLEVVGVHPTAPARTLSMDGVLFLDPDDYAIVRTRFAGEIVEVREVPDTDPHGAGSDKAVRPLRFGDAVQRGELLAVVWSRELGEKKSEYAATLAHLDFDRETLTRLNQARDSVPIGTLREAERRVREDEIAVERIEKTLRAWQLPTEEVVKLRSDLIATSGGEKRRSRNSPTTVSTSGLAWRFVLQLPGQSSKRTSPRERW
ncbi:MAG: hypothetical protein R3C19_09020 [Planctomycetaceae bacterium]